MATAQFYMKDFEEAAKSFDAGFKIVEEIDGTKDYDALLQRGMAQIRNKEIDKGITDMLNAVNETSAEEQILLLRKVFTFVNEFVWNEEQFLPQVLEPIVMRCRQDKFQFKGYNLYHKKQGK